MDTPPWYLQWVYGDPVMRRWRKQILGFCGFKPIRSFQFGPTRRGEAKQRIGDWEARIARAATTITQLRRGGKTNPKHDYDGFVTAIQDRLS